MPGPVLWVGARLVGFGLALAVAITLTSSALRAQESAPGCAGELAAVEASFEETIARLDASGSAGQGEKCDAIRHHLDVMASGIEVFERCLPPGHDRDENIGQLAVSIEDFALILSRQGCDAPDGGASTVLLDSLPPPVAAATWCAEQGPGFYRRRIFAGFIVFTVQCPGNHQNFIEALVVADDENGANARALVFPAPYDDESPEPYDVLSNIGWLEGGELSQLFIADPEEEGEPCRYEARWRLDGDAPTAELLFWRETVDCDGAGGWNVLVDQ